MRKITTLIVLALIALVTKAQLTTIHEFNQTNGSMPVAGMIYDGATYLYGTTYIGGISDTGTVYKLNVNDNTFTKLVDFTTDNGAYARNSQIIIGNTIYGTTEAGGNNNWQGVLYKIDLSNNNFSVIYNFESSTGYDPNTLIYDGTYIYGTTTYGGTNNKGVIFKFDIATNTYTKLYDFDNANGANPVEKLISDGDYLYGTTSYGGTNNKGVIFKFNKTTGIYSKLLDFDGTNGEQPYSLCMVNDYLYGVTHSGGTNNNGVIYRINKNQPSDFIQLNMDWTTTGANPTAWLTEHNNELYGVAMIGGNDDVGTIFKVDYNLAFTKLYDFDGTDGKYPNGNITFVGNTLYGVTQQGGSNSKGSIFKYDITTNSISFVNTKENINIYPSPASNNITISFNEIPDMLKITDVTGKTVFSTNNTNNTMNINISDYQEGMYFVISTKNNKKQVKKFIKN